MVSHFSSIGFRIKTQEVFVALANELGPHAEAVQVADGMYFHWRDGSGAEVWLQTNQDNELTGMTPHFVGKSRVHVGLTHYVTRPNDTPLDGALHGYVAPTNEQPESGSFPFVFDVPDFKQYTLEVPAIAEVQLTAFAHEVTLYDSVAAYNASLKAEVKFASQSFIPSGLFSPGGEQTEPPQSRAIFTGHITAFEKKVNSLTGETFIWTLVDTLDCSIDVVIDPSLISAAPKVGGVLSGAFWLSGRVRE